MQTAQRAERAPLSVEHREYQRNKVDLSGHLIVPAEDDTLPCRVMDLSGGGASITCEDPPPLHTYVILCIPGFGRLEGVTKRFVAGELGLQFVFKEIKRQRLLRDLCAYAQTGVAGASGLRRHARLASDAKVRITLAGGDDIACDVIDVSMQGLSLRTAARPTLEDLISIGGRYARVVRHHSDGIAVEFAGTPDGRIP